MKVTMQIHSIAKIEAEAIEATKQFSTVADACPYPFDTTAGTVFKRAFHKERARQEDAIQAAAIDDAISTGAALDITHSLDQFEALEGAAA